jgi:isoleucyl-tRNA synthetase
VPITVFVEKSTGKVLQDEAVNARIVEAFEAEGADAWFSSPPSRFLGNERNPEDYEKVDDVLDVWFDSGSTHAFVLESGTWPDLSWPANLYLEGSDQHRGWFQSSLLESVGTRGRAPYDAILTHGFILTADGHKMSKSLGNDIAPQKVVDQYGADILRLWVAAIDYTEDVRIGEEILKGQVDAYRKIRNTLRYLLGNLSGFEAREKLPRADMPELERWVLHRLSEIDASIRKACNDFEFNRMFTELYRFCAVDLSAVYFDIRKDALYCDARESVRRRAARTVLDELFSCLTAWFAPILCFTAEETWLARFPSDTDSVHLRQFPEIPADWRDEALGRKWEKIRALRRVVTGALEIERREKRIGASLQAAPDVYVEDKSIIDAMKGIDLAEIAITSGGTLIHNAPPEGVFMLEDVDGIGVVSKLADGDKCQRCWRVLPEVGKRAEAPDLCGRCADAVAGIEVV